MLDISLVTILITSALSKQLLLTMLFLLVLALCLANTASMLNRVLTLFISSTVISCIAKLFFDTYLTTTVIGAFNLLATIACITLLVRNATPRVLYNKWFESSTTVILSLILAVNFDSGISGWDSFYHLEQIQWLTSNEKYFNLESGVLSTHLASPPWFNVTIGSLSNFANLNAETTALFLHWIIALILLLLFFQQISEISVIKKLVIFFTIVSFWHGIGPALLSGTITTPLLLYLFLKGHKGNLPLSELVIYSIFLSLISLVQGYMLVALWMQFFYVNRAAISQDRLKMCRHLLVGLLTATVFFAVYSRLADLVYGVQIESNRTVDASKLSLFFSADYFAFVLESLPFLPNNFGYSESPWLGRTVSSGVFLTTFATVAIAGLAYENRKIFGSIRKSTLMPIPNYRLFFCASLAFMIAFLFICAAMLASFDVDDLALRNSLGRYIAPATALVLVSCIIVTPLISARILLVLYLFLFGFRLESLAPLRYDGILPVEIKFAWQTYFDSFPEGDPYCHNGTLVIENKSVFPSTVIEFIGYRTQPNKHCRISVVTQAEGQASLYLVNQPSKVSFEDFRPWGLSIVNHTEIQS